MWTLISCIIISKLLIVNGNPQSSPTTPKEDTQENQTTDTGYYDTSYYFLSNPALEWFEAERQCEEFNTTLATIITTNDFQRAMYVINKGIGYYVDLQKEGTMNISVWIGLYGNQTEWSWVDGTSCEYTKSGNCIDDIHWGENQPDGKPVLFLSWIDTRAAALYVPQLGHTNKSAYYKDLQYDDASSIYPLYLCNGPQSPYSPQNCTSNNCWENEYNFVYKTTRIIPTGWNVEFEPAVLFWNSTLFIFGVNQIDYTHFQIFDNHSNSRWYHSNSMINYTSNLDAWRVYTQYESSFYIYGKQFNGRFGYDESVLLEIDMNNLHVIHHSNVNFREQYPMLIKCIAATSTYVFMFGETGYWQYLKETEDLIPTPFGEYFPKAWDYGRTTSCVVTDDEKSILVFAIIYADDAPVPNIVVGSLKFDLENGIIKELGTSSVCLTRSGPMSSIAAQNDKVYVHGCAMAGWKTLVYDTKNEIYDNYTVDIMNPVRNELPHYRSSQLGAIDDNILFLSRRTNNGFAIDFTVIELISVNFKNTEMSDRIWPSYGFDFRYYVNDFSKTHGGIYNVIFTFNDDIVSVILNTSKDHCICNQSTYKCYNCYQHFNLKTYLTLKDDNINQLKFIPRNVDGMELLLVPKVIVMQLQRCVMKINILTLVTTNTDSSIKMNFSLSQNCHNRNGTNFSVSIIAAKVNMFATLVVGINNNHESVCTVCMQNNVCFKCAQNQFNVTHDVSGLDDCKFAVQFKSNMLDLKVVSTANTVEFHKSGKNTVLNNILLALLGLVLIPFAFIIYHWRQYMKSFFVDKALVLIIGISNFETSKLPGVKKNVIDLKQLWGTEYKYDVFVCKPDTLDADKADVVDFVDDHRPMFEDNHYKAAIVHIISHGTHGSFITADEKTIKLDFIQHELSECNVALTLLFHHGCQGGSIYHENMEIKADEDPVQSSRCCQCVPCGKKENDTFNDYESIQMPIVRAGADRNGDDVSGEDANVAIISGNIRGRAMSDTGQFTFCICKSFENNLTKKCCRKKCFKDLTVEIRRNLSKRTNGAEICNVSETLQFPQIRFEKSNHMAYQISKSHYLEDKSKSDLNEPLLLIDANGSIGK